MAKKSTDKRPGIGREEFRKGARAILIQVQTGTDKEGNPVFSTFVAQPKEFSTGSYGYHLGSEKPLLTIDGKLVKAQMGLNLVVVNSKNG